MEEYKTFKKKFKKDYGEDVEIDYPTPPSEVVEVVEPTNEQVEAVNEPTTEKTKYFIGAILMCDAGCTYAVIDTFTNSCVVEPIDNEGCFASEIMSFKAMETEGWKIIGRQI